MSPGAAIKIWNTDFILLSSNFWPAAKVEDATEKISDLRKNNTHLETKIEQLVLQRDDLNIAIEVLKVFN